MGSRRYRALIVWLLIAGALCLLPGPLYWSDRFPVQEVQEKREAGKPGRDAVAGSKMDSAESADSDSGSGSSSVIAKVMAAVLSQRRHEKEHAAHFVLMFGVAFCSARSLFAGFRPLFSVIASLLLVALVALVIEGLQELLPDFFRRGFSWDDLWFSLMGGLLGALGGVLRGGSSERARELTQGRN